MPGICGGEGVLLRKLTKWPSVLSNSVLATLTLLTPVPVDGVKTVAISHVYMGGN